MYIFSPLQIDSQTSYIYNEVEMCLVMPSFISEVLSLEVNVSVASLGDFDTESVYFEGQCASL